MKTYFSQRCRLLASALLCVTLAGDALGDTCEVAMYEAPWVPAIDATRCQLIYIDGNGPYCDTSSPGDCIKQWRSNHYYCVAPPNPTTDCVQDGTQPFRMVMSRAACISTLHYADGTDGACDCDWDNWDVYFDYWFDPGDTKYKTVDGCPGG